MTNIESTVEVNWDLSDLYESIDSDEFQQDKERVLQRANKFSQEYKDKVKDLDPEKFSAALEEYEQILEIMMKLNSFVFLQWNCDTKDEKLGVEFQKMTELRSKIDRILTFFKVEWRNLDEKKAEEILESGEVDNNYHYLEVSREYEPHTLTNPQEKVISAKDVTGIEAWQRFFEEQQNSLEFELDGERVTQAELSKLRRDYDRGTRKSAYASFTEGLEGKTDIFAYIFNTVLSDKATEDNLRNYNNWMESRNLANEITREEVESLIETVTDNYDLVQRFYNLKQEVLGYDNFYEYDRGAPLFDIDKEYEWEESKEIVLQSYSNFNKKMGEVANKFFVNNWIDAQVKPEKTNGAFSAPTTADIHPYVLVNYSKDLRSVQTLAHELGHGVHHYLAGQNQNFLQMSTPLTTAETASVFGEMLTFENLYSELEDNEEKLYLLAKKIDDMIGTVFFQIALNRFENSIHKARREGGELTTDQFNKLWRDSQEDMYGEAVELREDYDCWWSYIPHFIKAPGYVYAYAFGQLLVLALYDKYKHSDDDFSQQYIEVLKAGGSDWPGEIMSKVGVDISDPDFWLHGIEIIEKMISEAEELAKKVETN